MRIFRLVLIVALVLIGAYFKSSSVLPGGGSEARSFAGQSNGGSSTVEGVPTKALQVLEIVRRTGEAPEGYVGGRVFQNRENRLPAEGNYREFDVDPHEGGRNAERIIVEWDTKKAWYTGDHYRTFIPLP